MDSDDSRDDVSSGSESESNNKEPHSPSSVQSDSQDSRPQSIPRGPRSPTPSGPRSPSPEASPRSNSPAENQRSHLKDRFNDTIKSPSVNSAITSEDENTRNSVRSNAEEEGRQTPRSTSSRSSGKSEKSQDSVKSRNSTKSCSSSRPQSLKSPGNSSRRSVSSDKSAGRSGPRSPPPEDGNTSDSSASSQDSRISNRNGTTDRLNAQAEEISDGDMEYEGGKDSDDEVEKEKSKVNLSHEDLSDVSDLDSIGGQSEDEVPNVAPEPPPKPPIDLRHKIDEAKNRKLSEKTNPPEKTSKTEDGEEQLDFEAEDGECIDEIKPKSGVGDAVASANAEEEEGAIVEEPTSEKEVEEGEVTDDDEMRPEETEPRPVCRFYSRGQCTWGASCRFLHPGVTDKGNYTMFELIRPMVPGGPGGYGLGDERFERPGYGAPPRGGEPPVVESAWERGLRTAKEMMRKAIKRKEQDMDFEEKKMNLTLTQDELDKENGYYARSASPLPVEAVSRHYVTVRHPAEYRPAVVAPGGVDRRRQVSLVKNREVIPVAANARLPEEYYGRRIVYDAEPRTVRLEPEYEVPRERVRTYRELPAHRMPDYYNDKYEEPAVTQTRRPKREVIVQRVEPTAGRGDEWADPWMRSKSPGGRSKASRLIGPRRQSYSSASSYSSSSSSRSSSASSKSSYNGESRSRSRSPSSRVHRRIAGPKSPGHRLHRLPVAGVAASAAHRTVSPSVIISEKKAANERALLMNPPAPSPKKAHKDTRPPSPGMMRTSAQNPPAPTNKGVVDQYSRSRDRSKHESERKKLAVAAAIAASVKSRARISRSSSGSDSSGSSSSDSESTYSSSSSSRNGSPTPRRKVSEKVELAAMALKAKALDALKSADKRQIKLSIKSQPMKKSGLADLSELSRKVEKSDAAGQGKKRLASSPPLSDSVSAPKIAAVGKGAANNKKATSRREELLKQLKAVEDAIAKKRSKIN